VAFVVDTNILVYRFDARSPRKQRIADEVLRAGVTDGSVRVPPRGAHCILEPAEARIEAEEMLNQFEVLYPDETLLRTALRGAAAYQLPWFDAHMWAYAEHFGIRELVSEDFQHGRHYGTVRIRNPFA
jgi:predicted nucleic acid-binding protein